MLYTEIIDNIPGFGFEFEEEWNTRFEGCNCSCCCESSIEENSCKCLNYLKTLAYIKTADNDELILNLKLIDNLYPINECNLECNCDELKCSNRLVQLGPRFKMESFHTECRGIGLRTLDYIQAGSFVIEYLGELIGLKHAELLIEQREKNNEPNYIMFLREHFNHNKINTYVIDAKNYSNKARFINHSCEPNLVVVPIRIDNLVPHAALFALRNINALEELSYDYNQANQADLLTANINNNKIQCFCNTKTCKGYLPNSK